MKPTRYAHVTIAKCSAHYLGDELTHLGSAIERLRRQIAEQAIENEGQRLRLPSMRPNEGRKADVFMLLRLNRYLNYISTWLVASSPEPLRLLFAARNVGLIVLAARCTMCEAVTPAVKTGLSLELYAR